MEATNITWDNSVTDEQLERSMQELEEAEKIRDAAYAERPSCSGSTESNEWASENVVQRRREAEERRQRNLRQIEENAENTEHDENVVNTVPQNEESPRTPNDHRDDAEDEPEEQRTTENDSTPTSAEVTPVHLTFEDLESSSDGSSDE